MIERIKNYGYNIYIAGIRRVEHDIFHGLKQNLAIHNMLVGFMSEYSLIYDEFLLK